MRSRHVTLVLGLLLSAAVANEASAAEETDTRHPKPCGGYYACIEHQPPKPLPVIRQVKFFSADSGSTLP